MKLLTVIGARPQIIKAAAISRAIKAYFSETISDIILHTGQHYDENMSQQFFSELQIPQPLINLGIGSGPQGEQTAKMLTGIEQALTKQHFDGVIIYGDTNSTLAGALAASKIQTPVFHIEAGLRSYNMTMPEEQNRIISDQLSNICFAPTQTAVDNLRREGFFDSPTRFHHNRERRIILSGDVMYDNTLFYAQLASKQSRLLLDLQLKKDHYILATVHRNYNTDNHQRLTSIFQALTAIANETTVVIPLHPRTKKLLATVDLPHLDRLLFIPPVSYLEMLVLEQNAQVVMTDSGGVQKEAFFFERPCVIMRPETEWTEIIDHGAGILADADTDHIVEAYRHFSHCTVHFPPLFGDGHAAEKIVNEIRSYLS